MHRNSHETEKTNQLQNSHSVTMVRVPRPVIQYGGRRPRDRGELNHSMFYLAQWYTQTIHYMNNSTIDTLIALPRHVEKGLNGRVVTQFGGGAWVRRE